MDSGLLDLPALQQYADGQTIGSTVLLHEQVSSTNDLALQYAGDPADHGLVVFAESQSAGRGRLNRNWESPKGASILCTTLLFLDPESPPAVRIMFWSVLATRQALLESSNLSSTIKWPNDLMIRSKKVAGILIESRPCNKKLRAFALGIGINCLQQENHFSPDIRSQATSLEMEASEPANRMQVAQALLESLEYWHVKSLTCGSEWLAGEWLNHAQPLGQRVHLLSAGRRYSGSLVEIDLHAGILIELDHGGRRLFSPFTTTIESME